MAHSSLLPSAFSAAQQPYRDVGGDERISKDRAV
jgi:hypothetical protein